MWQCALQSVSQEMDSVWLPTIVAVIQDGLAVSVKHAYQLMDVVSQLYPSVLYSTLHYLTAVLLKCTQLSGVVPQRLLLAKLSC